MVSPVNATNLSGISELKAMAAKDSRKALSQVAHQFEAIFLQSMLKSMRAANQTISDSNPFKSDKEEMFQDMYDSQLAIDMANKRGIGLAEVLIKQMEKYLPQDKKTGHTSDTAKIEQVGKKLPAPEVKAAKATTKPFDGSFDDVHEFVKTLWPIAKDAAQTIGLDPKLLMAQAALETGWGKYVIKDKHGNSSHNLFNIKANQDWPRSKVDVQTVEYFGGVPRKVNALFKNYESLTESFSDYIKLLKNNNRYASALNSTHNPGQYIKQLHKAGYATDPNYSQKIMSIYSGEELNNALGALEVN